MLHGEGGHSRELRPAGVFVFIGLTPNTEIVRDLIALDERGFVVTDGMLQTSVPGIFAAGDVRHGSIKRVASGVGEGSMAIAFVHQYLADAASAPSRVATLQPT